MAILSGGSYSSGSALSAAVHPGFARWQWVFVDVSSGLSSMSIEWLGIEWEVECFRRSLVAFAGSRSFSWVVCCSGGHVAWWHASHG
jgi:hypothetical protein